MRTFEGIINRRIVMAAINEIEKNLTRYGGTISTTKSWAYSLVLKRMGYAKRKGTKDVKKLPIDFPEIQTTYLECGKTAMELYSSQQERVINIDQTGCQLLSGGQWTMEEQGSKQVTITGLDDKRQITVVLGATMDDSWIPV